MKSLRASAFSSPLRRPIRGWRVDRQHAAPLRCGLAAVHPVPPTPRESRLAPPKSETPQDVRQILLGCLDAGQTGCVSSSTEAGVGLAIYVMFGEVLAAHSADDDACVVRILRNMGVVTEARGQALLRLSEAGDSLCEILFEEIPDELVLGVLQARFRENLLDFLGVATPPEFEPMDSIFVENIQVGHDSRQLIAELSAVRTSIAAIASQRALVLAPGAKGATSPEAMECVELCTPRLVLPALLARAPWEPSHALALVAAMLDAGVLVGVSTPVAPAAKAVAAPAAAAAAVTKAAVASPGPAAPAASPAPVTKAVAAPPASVAPVAKAVVAPVAPVAHVGPPAPATTPTAVAPLARPGPVTAPPQAAAPVPVATPIPPPKPPTAVVSGLSKPPTVKPSARPTEPPRSPPAVAKAPPVSMVSAPTSNLDPRRTLDPLRSPVSRRLGPEPLTAEDTEEIDLFADHDRSRGEEGEGSFVSDRGLLDRVELFPPVRPSAPPMPDSVSPHELIEMEDAESASKEVLAGAVSLNFAGPKLSDEEARRKLEVVNEVLTTLAAALDAGEGVGMGPARTQLLIEGTPGAFAALFKNVEVDDSGSIPIEAVLKNLRKRPASEHRRLLNRGLGDLIERALGLASESMDDAGLETMLEKIAGYQGRLGI